MRVDLYLRAAAAIIIGLVTVPSLALGDSRACAKNFKLAGSTLSAQSERKFTTFDVSSDVTREVVFNRLARGLKAEGYEITGTDNASGAITALNPPTSTGGGASIAVLVTKT